jgi:DNA-binding MarR family transcriptional regulator
MAGIFEEIINFEQRRAYGGYALGGDVVAPSMVAELEWALNEAERKDMLQEAYIGTVYKDGKDLYVDTAFINNISGGAPGFKIKHLGMGEFVAEGPGGEEIELDRMRGKDFPGQSGRSHKIYAGRGTDEKIVSQLVQKMIKSGKAKLQKKLKIPTPKAMAKKTGMKVRAKVRGALQKKIYDFFMDAYQDDGTRHWITLGDMLRFKEFMGIKVPKLGNSLDAMVKSGLLDKGDKDRFSGDVQYRLAEDIGTEDEDVALLEETMAMFFESAPKLRQREAEEVQEETDGLNENDASILSAFIESGSVTMSAPAIADVVGLDKSSVRKILDEMSRCRLVSRVSPSADVWRLTHFGEAAISERKGSPYEKRSSRETEASYEKRDRKMFKTSPTKEKPWKQASKGSKAHGKKAHTRSIRRSKKKEIEKRLQGEDVADALFFEAKDKVSYSNKKLGVAMHNWHGGQGDPIYAVGSMIFAGKPVSRSDVEDAIDNLEGLFDDADSSGKRELKGIIAALKKGLKKKLGEAEEKGYKAQGPLEKMIGEMVRGQSGKWLSKNQMKAIVRVLNKKGITKPTKESYDDIARIVGKTLSALMKDEGMGVLPLGNGSGKGRGQPGGGRRNRNQKSCDIGPGKGRGGGRGKGRGRRIVSESAEAPKTLNRLATGGRGYQVWYTTTGNAPGPYISDEPTIQVAMRKAKEYAAHKDAKQVVIYDNFGNQFKVIK